MNANWLVAGLVVLTCTSVGCGTSPEEKAAEELQKSAAEMQKNAGDMQKGAEEMAKGFEAMARGLSGGAGGDSDVKPVEPVGFRELQTVMPTVAGWEKGSPSGEKMSSPFSFSQASITYTKGDAQIEQKIMDSGFNQLLFTPFTMFMAAGYEKETQDGYEKSVNIAGNPGWEKWDKTSRSGELNVVVGKRFLVQVEGHDLDDIKSLHTVLEQTDLGKLSSMK
ncbi:MAG: hypothetical protein ABL982_03600 [Vicinamibacterales bacterium]